MNYGFIFLGTQIYNNECSLSAKLTNTDSELYSGNTLYYNENKMLKTILYYYF